MPEYNEHPINILYEHANKQTKILGSWESGVIMLEGSVLGDEVSAIVGLKRGGDYAHGCMGTVDIYGTVEVHGYCGCVDGVHLVQYVTGNEVTLWVDKECRY
jgi:hypothetical protein